MELEIIDRNKLPHLNREEVTAKINFSGAMPSRLDVRKELAGIAKADEELVVVRQVKPAFGHSKADVSARIYDDEDSLKSIEGDYMVARHSEEAEQPAGEQESKATEGSAEEADEEPDSAEAGEGEQAEDADEPDEEEERQEVEDEEPEESEEDE